MPTAILILVVLGTIYGGLATATESAALGVIGAMIFAAIEGKLTFRMLNASAEATARNTAMIGLILFGAYVLNFMFVGLGVPQALAKLVSAMPLPPWGVMLLIIGFYLALGTFMEGFSMVVTTIPVVFPVVLALGYDPIWFGVIVTMMVEIALISPPDGTVLYVLQGMRRDDGPITDIFSGVMPFMLVYILAILDPDAVSRRRAVAAAGLEITTRSAPSYRSNRSTCRFYVGQRIHFTFGGKRSLPAVPSCGRLMDRIDRREGKGLDGSQASGSCIDSRTAGGAGGAAAHRRRPGQPESEEDTRRHARDRIPA